MSLAARIPVKFTLHSGAKIKTYVEGYHEHDASRATDNALDLVSRISMTLGGGPNQEEVTIDLPGCFILPSSVAAMQFGQETVSGKPEATNRAFYIVWDLQTNEHGYHTQFCGFFGSRDEAQKFWDNEEANRGYTPEGEISYVELPFTYGEKNIFYGIEDEPGISVVIFDSYEKMKHMESLYEADGRLPSDSIFFGGSYLKRGQYEGFAEYNFK